MRWFAIICVALCCAVSCRAFSLGLHGLYQTSMEDLSAEIIARSREHFRRQNQERNAQRGLLVPRSMELELERRVADALERGRGRNLDHNELARHKKNFDTNYLYDENEEDNSIDYSDPLSSASDSNSENTPFWHQPCGHTSGSSFVVRKPKNVSLRKGSRQLGRILEKVWNQLNITALTFQISRFDELYYEVMIGVNEDQYIPSWVPAKEDVPIVDGVDANPNEKVVDDLTTLHTQLQKFAVALEQISEDERFHSKRNAALVRTMNQVKMLLCEVEWALISLALPVPEPVSRDVMSPGERRTPDDTRRLVRDWGVLLKYRDFLSGWVNIANQMAQRQTHDHRGHVSRRRRVAIS